MQHLIRGLTKILHFKTKKAGKVRKFLIKQAIKNSQSTVMFGLPRNTALDGHGAGMLVPVALSHVGWFLTYSSLDLCDAFCQTEDELESEQVFAFCCISEI